MNAQLEALTSASPYRKRHGASPPKNPQRGTVWFHHMDNRPTAAWPVNVFNGDAWVCIGHGAECSLQAADATWALGQADSLSLANKL